MKQALSLILDYAQPLAIGLGIALLGLALRFVYNAGYESCEIVSVLSGVIFVSDDPSK